MLVQNEEEKFWKLSSLLNVLQRQTAPTFLRAPESASAKGHDLIKAGTSRRKFEEPSLKVAQHAQYCGLDSHGIDAHHHPVDD